MNLSLRTKVNIGFLLALGFLIVISIVSRQSIQLLVGNAGVVAHTHEVMDKIEEVASLMKDLETGQRGFVITGNEEYLEPYFAALNVIDVSLDQLFQLVSDNPNQVARISQLRDLKAQKVGELKFTIALRKKQGFEAARARVAEGLGRRVMDSFRTIVTEMKADEAQLLAKRNATTNASTNMAMWVIVVGGLLSVLMLLAAAFIVNRSETARNIASLALEKQTWIRSGLLSLSEKMTGEQSITGLARNIIETIVTYVRAQVGSVYLVDESKQLKWAAGYAYPSLPSGSMPEQFQSGQSLVGQAASQKKEIIVSELPDNYIKVSSSLGEASPKHLFIVPFLHEGEVKGVTEVGSFNPLTPEQQEFIKQGLNSIGVAVNSAQVRTQVAALLQKTQLQAEELQAQQEELRTTNEELENKTDELRAQQDELRQSNEELEEQRAALEDQKEELEQSNRDIESARKEIEEKAHALETASKYKSEFLANMSHELRTPLNSILLLSKALAENAEKNLTKEQREYGATIYSSGADLLNLINDILDLAKVEAGKLDIQPAETDVAEICTSLTNLFRPQMEQKGLSLRVEVGKDCPPTLFTDRLRLEQIIKNFLSNAMKFTEKGQVILSFNRLGTDILASHHNLNPDNSVIISVRDSGIGIPEDRKAKIFEAFEQVDSSTSRKYGGAGLGLTIASEIAGLLGGEIQVQSQLGSGSVFSLLIPVELPNHPRSAGASKPNDLLLEEPEALPLHPTFIPDDRNNLQKGDRIILVIEDDSKFAAILQTVCKKHNFKCIVAGDGKTGLDDALSFHPDAILLDLRLPIIDGITVLDRLKQNPKTRHIPVHVTSVENRSIDVLRKGAVGFLSKPVAPKDLENAFAKIEKMLSNKPKKVLVVEDKKLERDAILKLIEGEGVKSWGVGTGEEALSLLQTEPFDCIILDLKLPDISGFEVMRTMEKDNRIPPTPIIVYTGRDLSKDELEEMNRFSRSIILKGVRSEERLLDEVTLFLHKVESDLPDSKREMIERVRHREDIFDGKKLLVVDDDMRNVFALRSILMKKGFAIYVAKTGVEALNALKEHPEMDAVLMDVMMPEMDGIEAIHHIREDLHLGKLPIVALTAKAMKADREKCLEAGANDYLPKPVDMDSLLSLLRVWLSQ